MKFTCLIALVLCALAGFAQPMWVTDEPQSESGKYYYFVGEGTSRDEAFLDALQALAFQVGIVTGEFTTEQKRSIINETVNSDFERTGKITVGEKELVTFMVKKWNDGEYYYHLLGSPKKGSSTEGGVMAKSNFIWRSSLVPGWGQFFNKEPSKGLVFSVGEVALIGSTIFSFRESSSQQQLANMALLNGNLAQYTAYSQNVKAWNTTGTILGAGAIALWVLNVVDATATEKNLYVWNEPVRLNLLAVNHRVGLTFSF